MKKFVPLLITTLFLSGSLAWAGAAKPVERDLRHCLDLQSNLEIAKCAGELTPGKAGAHPPRKAALASDMGKKEAAKNEAAQKETAKKQ